jgi:hypothetical protein
MLPHNILASNLPTIYEMQMHVDHTAFSLPLFGEMSRLGLYGIVILSVGLAVFIGACLVVVLCKRPAVIAAYLPFLLFPLLLGVHGSVAGHYEFYEHLGQGEQIRVSSLAADQAESLHRLYFGILATWPSFLVVAVGLFVRTLGSQRTSLKAIDPATPTSSKILSG